MLWALLLAPWESLWGGVHGQALWRFTEVTGESGLTAAHGYQAVRPSLAQNAAGGVAAGDYDGDGHVDLYVIGGDAAPNRLFHNQRRRDIRRRRAAGRRRDRRGLGQWAVVL